MTTVATTLVAGYLCVLLYETVQIRRTLVAETETLCRIVADRTSYALVFQDARAAEETLSAMAVDPDVMNAAVLGADGRVFASFAVGGGAFTFPHPDTWPDRSYYRGGVLFTLCPVSANNLVVGHAALSVSGERLRQRTRDLALIVVGLLGVTVVLALLVSSRLQRVITSPIFHLVAVARRISRPGADYSQRAEKSTVEELAILSDAFNGMLDQIEQRDRVLSQANQILEQRVAERTAELVAAKDTAERANRAKTVFLANMSHELRTPLHAVLGFSRLLRDSPGITPRQSESLEIISRSGERLLDIINNVLEIARIEAGRVVLEESAFDLHQMLYETQSLMSVKAAEKGLSFALRLAPDLPRHVWGDARKLGQVLLNLVGNAIKYTEIGGATLRAAPVARESPERIQIRFEVEDTGPGISPEDRGRLFSPFVRLDERQSAEGGTGLGLALSKEYVELMGGAVTVESELGHGSVFHFEIWMRVLTAEAAETPTLRMRVAGLAEGEPHYRILIVEDQAESRLLVRWLIEPLGFEVAEANNGQQAVELFQEWHPELIFMDIRMPVMDGMEATRIIRELPDGGRCKIVAVTAHALEEEKQVIVSAGFNGFIRKPYREGELFSALEQQLGARFVLREQGEAPPEKPKGPFPLAVSEFERLPRSLVEALAAAAEQLDQAASFEAVERISALDAGLADRLRQLIDELRFKDLLVVLDRLNGRSER
jgi:signal transduction histidine kinase/CheY-like chemotaxis protein